MMTDLVTAEHMFRYQRRIALSRQTKQIGLDYIQVESQQTPNEPNKWALKLHFVPASAQATQNVLSNLTSRNIRITRGTAVSTTDVRLLEIQPPSGNVLTLLVEYKAPTKSQVSDLSTYTLQLLNISNLDPFFERVNFSFKRPNQVTFDPQPVPSSDIDTLSVPEIDYLAKDYSSFRQLMLNRLSEVMPQWLERNPADLGIALVEVLAYSADYLSYYQDAVATEAYLGTARRRTSVRRHGRLVDYVLHEGCNARVWVQVAVNTDQVLLEQGTLLLTHVSGQGSVIDPDSSAKSEVLAQGAKTFQTLHSQELFAAHNEIKFYTWGAREWFLSKQETKATLIGHLALQPGDVLIFEEVRDPNTGLTAGANPQHRHPVRLTKVTPTEDPLGGQFHHPPTDQPVLITEIEWHPQDALPYQLWLATLSSTGPITDITVARGNIVLADHGEPYPKEGTENLPTIPTIGSYRPKLSRTGLTHSVPYNHQQAILEAVATTLVQDPRSAVPQISLQSDTGETWLVHRDLLNSDRFAADFVVEMESDGTAYLRFGDSIQGKQPSPDSQLITSYRIGNGLVGNVGLDAIAHLEPVTSEAYGELVKQVTGVRNPIAAQGGIDPEPIEQARLYAPQAFRTPERCVTESDYATTIQRHPEVQKAAAQLRWTGSWYSVFIVVDRYSGRPIDAQFREELLAFMAPYRLMGHDLEIQAPYFVNLDIALTVHVLPNYFQSSVKRSLMETFSNTDLAVGQRGFFHPDNFTFGQPVYLSQIVNQAMAVPGVDWVEPTRFREWGQPDRGELAAGQILIEPLAVARLDNNPDTPENGRSEFYLLGGL